MTITPAAPAFSPQPPASFRVALATTSNTGESDELRNLIDKAGEGDRDAALALAKHYASGDAPDHETAAKYAIIALTDGGWKYAAHFIPNTRAWPREFWTLLQLELQTNGTYDGAIDGLPGRGTRAAVRHHAGVKANAPVKRKPRKKPPRGSHSN